MVEIDPIAQVRLLVNDTNEDSPVFADVEYVQFLTLENQSIKRAAAQAVDTIADNEALVAKYVRDHEITVDGTKVADSLRKRADSLRAQALDDEQRAGDDAYFEFIPPTDCYLNWCGFHGSYGCC